MLKPRITKVEIETFTYEQSDLGRGEHGPTFSPGKSITNTAHAITISTDVGVSGEYVWSGPIEYAGACVVAELIVGQDPLEREYIYSRIKQAMRQQAEIGISAVDIALWDLAGKYYDAPIHRLLGGYRKTLPTYPASVHATEHDELKSPGEMADFAEQCKELGYPAFKIHGWENGEPRREAETILAVRDRVGSDMDLMSDPTTRSAPSVTRSRLAVPVTRRATSGTRTRWRTGASRSSRTASCGNCLIPRCSSPSTFADWRRGSTSWSTARPTSCAATCSTWASPQR